MSQRLRLFNENTVKTMETQCSRKRLRLLTSTTSTSLSTNGFWRYDYRASMCPVPGCVLTSCLCSYVWHQQEIHGESRLAFRSFLSCCDVIFKGIAGRENSTPQHVAQGWQEQEMTKPLSEYDPDDYVASDLAY